MKKFLQSEAAFMLVAVLCFAAGMLSDKRAVFMGLGAFWLVMSIVARAKNIKKQSVPESPEPRDQSLTD